MNWDRRPRKEWSGVEGVCTWRWFSSRRKWLPGGVWCHQGWCQQRAVMVVVSTVSQAGPERWPLPGQCWVNKDRQALPACQCQFLDTAGDRGPCAGWVTTVREGCWGPRKAMTEKTSRSGRCLPSPSAGRLHLCHLMWGCRALQHRQLHFGLV